MEVVRKAFRPEFINRIDDILLFRRLSRDTNPGAPLSDREREVLQLVARGHKYKEISASLFIAEKTVENHVRNILGKLHLNRREELIRFAVEHGLD